jgi:hypothetical protein
MIPTLAGPGRESTETELTTRRVTHEGTMLPSTLVDAPCAHDGARLHSKPVLDK